MKNKAIRRHHTRRLRKKAEKILRISWGYDLCEAKERAPKVADNLKKCSCSYCTVVYDRAAARRDFQWEIKNA